MKIGIVGCGFVLDKYMATWGNHPDLIVAGVTDINVTRIDAVTRHYGFTAYPDTAALLADPSIDIVCNFTPIRAHYEVSKAALEAGKHVYSEKPLVTSMDQARELFALAESRGLRLSGAPSNALGGSTQTIWKAISDGAVGKVRLVYAEYDTPPLYLAASNGSSPYPASTSFPYLNERSTMSVTGALFPFIKEFEMGCTYEHVAYQLSWMCMMFGPVKSVTAFSKLIMPDKTDYPLDPPDTPDFSVASLDFQSGVAGRVTCSVAGPSDLQMRIIGDRGILSAKTCHDYKCPVHLEQFSKLSIKAKYVTALTNSAFLRWVLGIEDRSLPLIAAASPGPRRMARVPWWNVRGTLAQMKQAEMNRQDMCIGISELAAAIEAGRPQFPSHAFTLHLTELTLAIQAAGTRSKTHVMDTTFDPVEMPQATRQATVNYSKYLKPKLRTRMCEQLIDAIRS